MNILVKPNDYNHIISICHVLMTDKSYISYINIFNDLKLQLFLNQIKVDWEIFISYTISKKGQFKQQKNNFQIPKVLVVITIFVNHLGYMLKGIKYILKK